jgi:RNA polymerase sigma-70 factor, ECF subfamily
MSAEFGCMLTEVAPPLSDEEIVKRVLDGETSLFELLIRRYNQRLYRAARAILKDDAEAEDAMQEAYVRAFVKLDQFAGDAKLSTWLTKIAVYEALGRLRRRKRMDEMPEILSSENPERAAYGRELQTAIESAVDALPPLYRSVFVLREIEEMTGAETADCLGITEETVKTRLHRARRLLRHRLERTVGAAMESAFAFGSRRCDRVTEKAMERIRLLQPDRSA